jgi:phosphomannomutase
MQVSASLFKAYDLRGVVPDTVDEDVAHALGRAFAVLALGEGERTVAVGRDGRLSGPALSAALTRGLLEGGLDVIDVGAVTTPLLWFATSTLCRTGIQVTASHNPRDHNGFKMVVAGRSLHGEDLQALRRAIEAEDWPTPSSPGKLTHADVFPAYLARIEAHIHLARPLKIVLDSGNGIGGAYAPQVFRALGCEVVELYSDVDGNFPNHHPDPSKPENLRDLIAAVREAGADLGFALDGDGDRLGVVTRSGQVVYPDRQLVLFAQDVLARVPGAAIVYDVKCTQRLGPAIRAAGGTPVMCRSGYPLMKQRMQEVDAPLAGEMSGHVVFRDRWFGFDDGTYAGCRMLEILARHADPGAVLEALPTSHSTPELNIRCAEGEPHRIAAELVARAHFPGAQVTTMDGLRVDWDDGFGLVRASNTTPVLVLRFEGHTREAMQRIEGEMMALLRTVVPGAVIDR